MKANYEKRLQERKQLKLYDIEVRVRSKEKEAETVTHDFTCSFVLWITTQ